MSARYEINRNEDGTSYHFLTSSRNTYIAYFTEFTLQDQSANDVPVLSFGFSCKLGIEEKPQRYDARIKHTILYNHRYPWQTHRICHRTNNNVEWVKSLGGTL